MQRDIKFKYVIKDINGNYKSEIFDLDTVEKRKGVLSPRNIERGFELVARLQHTGLKDNDREIWEGDVYEHPNGQRFVVCYMPQMTGFRAVYSDDNDSSTGSSIALQIGEKGQAKYIGNAITQPELLECTP